MVSSLYSYAKDQQAKILSCKKCFCIFLLLYFISTFYILWGQWTRTTSLQVGNKTKMAKKKMRIVYKRQQIAKKKKK